MGTPHSTLQQGPRQNKPQRTTPYHTLSLTTPNPTLPHRSTPSLPQHFSLTHPHREPQPPRLFSFRRNCGECERLGKQTTWQTATRCLSKVSGYTEQPWRSVDSRRASGPWNPISQSGALDTEQVSFPASCLDSPSVLRDHWQPYLFSDRWQARQRA